MMSVKHSADEIHAALLRADRLIRWMSEYVRAMAPGDYHECYREFNEHACYMQELANKERQSHDKGT